LGGFGVDPHSLSLIHWGKNAAALDDIVWECFEAFLLENFRDVGIAIEIVKREGTESGRQIRGVVVIANANSALECDFQL